jgi:ADP-ribose pyrophosphatase YjhB (NUDIX family)
MNFCSDCGAPVSIRIPPGDTLPRHVCTQCQRVHYSNPRILVSCLATFGVQALWMKRAQPPAAGKWSVPGGFLEQGETLQQAAARELFEETGAEIDPASLQLYGVGSVVDINQVYVSFRAQLPQPLFGGSPEALEVALFDVDSLPWDQLAFPDIIPAVRNFYRELSSGEFGIYLGEYVGGTQSLRRI